MNQDKKEVESVLDKVHQQLDSLQGKDATFLFVGNEGNHFAISGKPVNITAQIIFAMCRYPIIEEIIKECADRFCELNAKYGEGVRKVQMTHLIEQIS